LERRRACAAGDVAGVGEIGAVGSCRLIK